MSFNESELGPGAIEQRMWETERNLNQVWKKKKKKKDLDFNDQSQIFQERAGEKINYS
jgi:hypothetical protein